MVSIKKVRMFIVVALAFFLIGCGGTWFSQSKSTFPGAYKDNAYSKKKTDCKRSISHLSPELNSALMYDCMKSTVIY